MKIECTAATITALEDYARIEMAFEVTHVFDVAAAGDDGGAFTLVERELDAPWVKSYDVLPGEGPTNWAKSFDVSNLWLFAAHIQDRRVGGAAVAFDTPGVDML